MPTIKVNGAELYYEDRGSGTETMLFAHGLAFDHRMYESQVAHFAGRYRCVTFDFRGHGQSQVTPGGYDMDTLAEDAAAIIDVLDLGPVHFVGLSMGGFVGMRLALHYPELLRSLTLMDTSAEPEPKASRRRFTIMRLAARWLGIRVVVDRLMGVVFGADFLADPGRAEEKGLWRDRMLENDRVGVSKAARAVLERRGVADRIGDIRVPTLVIVGEADAATPAKLSRRMHEAITGSRLEVLPGVGHMANLEAPGTVNEILGDFLASVPEKPASDL